MKALLLIIPKIEFKMYSLFLCIYDVALLKITDSFFSLDNAPHPSDAGETSLAMTFEGFVLYIILDSIQK